MVAGDKACDRIGEIVVSPYDRIEQRHNHDNKCRILSIPTPFSDPTCHDSQSEQAYCAQRSNLKVQHAVQCDQRRRNDATLAAVGSPAEISAPVPTPSSAAGRESLPTQPVLEQDSSAVKDISPLSQDAETITHTMKALPLSTMHAVNHTTIEASTVAETSGRITKKSAAGELFLMMR